MVVIKRKAEGGYQGWTNYETWAANNWLDESGSELSAVIQEFKNEIEDKESAIYEASEALKEIITEQNPVESGTIWSDLMEAALSAVNWRAIVETAWDKY